MNKTIIFTLCLLFFGNLIYAQNFSRQDSLRGGLTPERVWWNLQHYHLKVTVSPESKSIKGSNVITYRVVDENQIMQIDLQPPMKLDQVIQDGVLLSFTSEGNAHFIQLKNRQKIGAEQQLTLHFSGTPRIAKHPPWDGGFTWKKDDNGMPFIATSNQGIGASVWWPNKDHPYDEPDRGIELEITVPKELTAVGNGRLVKVHEHEGLQTWHWKVVNPINNYGVNINIGDYTHFSETYEGIDGTLDMDYYVLKDNLSKAKEQFKQAKKTIEAFEYWFGPYPFYEDSYKLVEVPYLGMEHQSSVTYGNQYQNGYLGRDLSMTGWGLKFDFIIIHESGHEWFANNITNRDVADMWIHEGFTAYSESLYLDYHFSEKAASEYVVGTRHLIQNDRPIVGTYGVHHEGSGDMYYKGSNILHTLRQLLEDDEKWRSILIGLNTNFRHQTVTSQQVENYISKASGIDLTEFWEQYLRSTKIPLLEYKVENNEIHFRYTEIIDGFDMPIIMEVNGEEHWLFPSHEWKTKAFDKSIETAKVKMDFYIDSKKIENP